MKNPIYTIGYQGLDGPHILMSLMDAIGAVCWDVRKFPISRRQHWKKAELEPRLNRHRPGSYEWHGDTLGGLGTMFKPVSPGIIKLKERQTPVILLCQEESPGDCHRHNIVMTLGEKALHFYRDEVIDSRELHRSLLEDTDYEFEPIQFFLERFDH